MKNLTQTKLIMSTTVFLVLFDNYTFFQNTLAVYPLQSSNLGFLLSLIFVLTALTIVVLTLVSSKWTTKPILISVLLISSLTNYFMNTYNVIIDVDMIRNVIQTDLHESLDLLTIREIFYFLLLGVIPSFVVYKSNIDYKNLKVELFSKIKTILISLIVIVLSIYIFSSYYASFFREHRALRDYTNPTAWIYGIGNYINKTYDNATNTVVQPIENDAKVVELDDNITKRTELIIMVVGEAARADHFSLNGYEKETNPLLKKEDIVNFPNMYSCGTSTAVSVPCMFSVFDKDAYSYKKGISTENVLDVLNHTNNIDILWRDNNSDSKGVALRVPYEDYRTAEKNTICTEGECRDEGMLVGLDKYIEAHKGRDILIVLHQMGNHGPAYYKRYPKEFEKFAPICKTNELGQCSKEEISNAYDNAILYTDYFLTKVINLLKKYDKSHNTGMIYMSDHGESLGENGVYLHGLPYFMAPDAQTHIGALMWFGKGMKKEIDIDKMRKRSNRKYTQDNLFHSLLGIFEVNTKIYDKTKDIFN